MSAWVVEKVHIDALVTAAIDRAGPGHRFSYYHNRDRHYVTIDNADEVGQMLWDENFASVNHLYIRDDPAPRETYRFRRTAEIPAIALQKGIICYEYQSCEHDGWDTSAAKAFCEELRQMLITRDPGYDKAAGWGFSESDRGNPPVSLFEMAGGRR